MGNQPPGANANTAPDRRSASERRARSRSRDHRVPAPASQSRPVDVHRASGQADPAHDEEDERKHKAQHAVRVSQRIQRQVTGLGDRSVTTKVRNQRMTELVQAQ